MAVYQISKIQIRRGQANSGVEFPQLASGEMGWAIDSQELFIGNGSVSEGAPLVGNTKILTNHDDLLATADYSYKITSPGIITGLSSNTPIYRPLQARLDDRVNVADFGAEGNGVDDDSDAINRAITQLFANSGNPAYQSVSSRFILEFPAGIYNISKTIKIPSYTTIVGYGIDKTIIQYTGLGTAVQTVADTTGAVTVANQPRKIKISDLTISTTALVSPCVDLSNTCNSEFYNIEIKGATLSTSDTNAGLLLNAVSAVSTNDNIFKNIIIKNFRYGIFNNQYAFNNIFEIGSISNVYSGIIFGNALNSNQNQINNFKFNNITNIGIYVKTGTQNQISNCYMASVGTSTPQIFFTDIGNKCNNLTSNRSTTSLIGDLTSKYYSEVAGYHNYTSNTFSVDMPATGGAVTPLFRLPLNCNTLGNSAFSVSYTVNYTYTNTANDLIRHGTLNIVANPTSVTLSDDYTGLGAALTSWAIYLQISFSAVIANNTVVIRSTNSISNDNGKFTYSYTASF